MSFKCDTCETAQPTHAKPNRVVVQNRNVSYKLKDGRITTGTEIVKELDLCGICNG